MFLMLLPMAYMMADGGENVLIARMLTGSLPIDDQVLASARFFTIAKFVMAGASLVQVAIVIAQAKIMRVPIT